MTNLLDQVKRYKDGAIILKDWLLGGAEVVDREVAQSRASVCLSCPNNKDGLKIAEAVSAEIRKQIELKKHLQLRVQGEKQLKTCALCLCPLKLKVHVPIENIRLDETEKQMYPDYCWMKIESL